MTVTKIYLCQTTMVLTAFTQTQFSEFNQMLSLNRKTSLYCNENNTELFLFVKVAIFFMKKNTLKNSLLMNLENV